MVERCFISHIDGGGYRRHGAVETRRPMRGDGLAQEEVAVWHHGDVDGRVARQGRSLNICSEDGPVEDGGDSTRVRLTGLCPRPGMWLGWGFRLLMLGLG
jgi:hypothetical protein